ncbi:hypothetical protein MASR2M18_06320 [Ignavibacteria bacterium]|jgi:SAM-dependent methyltransferase|nr:DUF268 domain-containing protein [Bacteroidota bacterium]MCZ2132498.1 DUF268 domain-containing protein [Bacteroidota bacterium]
MIRFNSPIKNFAYFCYRWIAPVIDPIKLLRSIPNYFGFFADWLRYKSLDGAERVKLSDLWPNIHDKTSTTPFLRHYFYQDVWAARNIAQTGVVSHVDVASRIDFVGFLTSVTHVTFIDIRPLEADLPNFTGKAGSILAMPFADGEIASLSCLHVAEHIGLGRYGDPLDPQGTIKACKELARVLVPGGRLYFSTPIGAPRLCFNAHRIHSVDMILEYFSDLTLVRLDGIDDANRYHDNIDRSLLDGANYACGLFIFTK